MIELIVTMIIVGIMAVAVAPRFADRSLFAARGFEDQTLSLLRYAQKAAIAQHRYVCVTFSAGGATLGIGATSACGTNLAGPDGTTPFSISAGTGTGYAAVPANFYFEPSGRPSLGQTISVTGAGSVAVEAETGYVR